MSKYEVGQKFTIELAEKFKGSDGHTLYRVEPFASMVLDKNGLDKLTPANDSYNAYQDGYEEGYVIGYGKGKDEAYKNPVPTQDAYNNGARDMYMAMLWSARNTNADTPKLWAVDVNNHSYHDIIKTYKDIAGDKIINGLKKYLQKNLIEIGCEVRIDYPSGTQYGVVTNICESVGIEYISVLMQNGDNEYFKMDKVGDSIFKTGKMYKIDEILSELNKRDETNETNNR